MGRRPTPKGLDRDKVVSVWEETGSINKTAKIFDVRPGTVRYHLNKAGKWFPLPKDQIKPSCFKRWLEDNPNHPIPYSLVELSKLTGCSRASIQKYLNRRAKKIHRMVKALGDLRKLPDFYYNKTIHLQPQYFYRYYFSIHPFTLQVQLSGAYEDGEPFFCMLSFSKMLEMYQAANPTE
jgi:hypothetical protein